ncbi:hypothetical protein B7G54_26155 [Burkholderia puraquae]|uniref:Uncharacterized protein n=1 Tax=Burkholderia puraquae TaxID=1904757 RepID=A0A1X1PBI6_9BURK|nr:hypothetical protein B7G54_26155 [Burkholderia puraquae]
MSLANALRPCEKPWPRQRAVRARRDRLRRAGLLISAIPGIADKRGRRAGMEGIELIDGAGHWIQQEQPVRLGELLLAFAKEVVGADHTRSWVGEWLSWLLKISRGVQTTAPPGPSRFSGARGDTLDTCSAICRPGRFHRCSCSAAK